VIGTILVRKVVDPSSDRQWDLVHRKDSESFGDIYPKDDSDQIWRVFQNGGFQTVVRNRQVVEDWQPWQRDRVVTLSHYHDMGAIKDTPN
jgi:hypothetical protein